MNRLESQRPALSGLGSTVHCLEVAQSRVFLLINAQALTHSILCMCGLNLFKQDCFPGPTGSTAVQRAVLLSGEGGELQAGGAVQGQGSSEALMSC